MDSSFTQRILDNIERRSKAIGLSDECKAESFTDYKGKENLLTTISSFTTNHIGDRVYDTEGNMSILTERNCDDSESIECEKLEIIYANSNVIRRNEGDGLLENTLNNNGAVPIGRKPALPPKPSSRIGTASLSILKPKGLVQSAKAVFFDKSPLLKSPPGKRDPAEMTLKERLALFEKNKGSALMPKAPLAMSVSTKQIHCDIKGGNDQAKEPLLSNSSALPQSVIINQNSNSKLSIINDESIQQYPTSVPGSRFDFIEKKSPNTELKDQTIDSRYKSFKSQLTDVIDSLDRSISPPVPIRTTESLKLEPHIEAKCTVNNKRRSGEFVNNNRLHIPKNDVKRAKTYHTSTIGNSLYGDLTPITTTVAPTKRPDETIGLNELHQTDPDRSLVNNDINFNQQQSKDEDSLSFGSPKNTSIGIFDLFQSTTTKKRLDFNDSSSIDEISSKQNGTMSVDDDDDSFAINLTFDSCANDFTIQEEIELQTTESGSASDDEIDSLASYREKQMKNVSLTPSIQRTIIYPTLSQYTFSSNDDVSSILNKVSDVEQQIQEKINRLLNDASIQKHHITQASHALNTCAASFAFSGSTESALAEWKLLVTTHSRDATLQELSRLRQKGFIREPSASKDCGRLIISDINIPLQQDYIAKLATDTIWGHHLVCLLKMEDSENVVATKTIRILPGLVAVKFPDSLRLENVFSDFEGTLEVYGMLAQPEELPHDIKKYHIKTKTFAGFGIALRRTPKSKKTKDLSRRAELSTIPSIHGENIVRKPNFQHFGSVRINLSQIRRTNWPINLNVDDSPLNSVLSMKIKCELDVNVKYKAFLTIFEDVSGFGAWNRRWCYLNGHTLNYWKYPDDEQMQPPLESIDLTFCKQDQIALAPRDLCTRLNTLMILLHSHEANSEKKTLVTYRESNKTVRRYLLSCDTKAERIEWCEHLNKSLQRSKEY